MKKYILFIFLSIFMISCETSDNNPIDDPTTQPSPTIDKKEIIFKISNWGTVWAKGKFTIDWSNGKGPVSVDNKYLSLLCNSCSVKDSLIIISTDGLEELVIENSKISDLQIGEAIDLKKLGILGDNIIVNTIDLTKCPNLETFSYGSSISKENGKLKKLEINNPKLKYLFVGNSYLKSLDLFKAPELVTLELISGYIQDLTSINLNNCSKLKILTIIGAHSELTSLDLSANIDLESLKYEILNRDKPGKISSLNLSNNKKLKTVSVVNAGLESLDVTNNTALNFLDIYINKFSKEKMENLFNSLPNKYGRIDIGENPGTNESDKLIARNKGWNVIVQTRPEYK